MSSMPLNKPINGGRQGEKIGVQRATEYLWRQGQNGASRPKNDTGAPGGKNADARRRY